MTIKVRVYTDDTGQKYAIYSGSLFPILSGRSSTAALVGPSGGLVGPGGGLVGPGSAVAAATTDYRRRLIIAS